MPCDAPRAQKVLRRCIQNRCSSESRGVRHPRSARTAQENPNLNFQSRRLIMKTLSITRAVVVAAGLVLAHGASASPDDGVKCPAGFTSSFNGTSLTCVKH